MSTEWPLQWVVTIHIQWNLYWKVHSMGGHHLHYHPYSVACQLNGPSNGWSSPPLPSIYSGTSMLWSLQWVVITSITIHTQWNLYFMVPPMGGHHLHYHPCTVEPLLVWMVMEVMTTHWRDHNIEVPLYMDGNGGDDHPLEGPFSWHATEYGW